MNGSDDATRFPWEGEEQTAAAAGDADSGANTAALEEGIEASLSDDELADMTEPRDDAGAARRADRPLVRKEYYSISEVADLVGLPAHVLRYWESQFSVLNPSKNRSGNRVYQRKEIRLILLVKQLLHDDKYTVEGAKQKLEQLRRGGELPQKTAHALDVQLLQVLREDLRELNEILSPETI